MDVRALAGNIGRGQWEDAWKVLRRYMPLPGILGRICDAPCEDGCKRNEAGGSIRIGALERACVQTEAPSVRVVPLPSKNKKIAIAGGGMSSLTAAWDLVRKGYGVTVFEAGPVPGTPLRNYDFPRLPAEAVDAEIALLQQLGVRFETGCDPDTGEIAERCVNWFDAVYLGLDGVGGHAWNLGCDEDGLVRVDAAIQSTSRERVFAGGRNPSPVWQAAQGRWAATSIDRFLQGVSIAAGREKEGPYATRLYTSLADVVPLSRVPMEDAHRGYAASEAMEEARRCLQCDCRECVKVCAYLEHFGAYPKKYAREVYNNLSIVMGEHKANRLINSCSLCGLCERVCPNDFAMQDLCLDARRKMVESVKMPPSAHEFALLDMEFSQSERFALARHQPGWESSTYLFFPDPDWPDPAERPRPVWSLRRENRARLKAQLSVCLWNEEPVEMNAYQRIKLEIAPEVAESMDRRRILVEDLQQVIHHAETSGDRLFNPSSGRYKAAYAPYAVTFWVEYTPSEEGFVVHNAYSHRMEVLGP